MATLSIVPRVEGDKVTLPWMFIGKNDLNKDAAWRRESTMLTDSGEIAFGDGPDGIYWDTDYKGTFNKNVYIIEGDDPIPPPTEPPIKISLNLPQNEYSEIRLNAAMTTRDGVRLSGWDIYEGAEAMVIGETDHYFIIRQDMPDFNWAAWGYNPSGGSMGRVIKDIATGPAYKDQKEGEGVVAWRMVPVGGKDTTTPWQPIEHSNSLLTGPIYASDPQFRYRPDFGSPHPSSFVGQRYWKLPKLDILKAIRVTVEDYDYPTVNLNPSYIIEITFIRVAILASWVEPTTISF